MPPSEPNYGVDAPPVVFGLVMAAVVLALMGVFIGSGAGTAVAGIGPWIAGVMCAAGAVYMIYSSKVGKPARWRRTLDGLALRGDEQVLDVGCGRGLVLIELAKRLPEGRAVGVDIWRNKDQSGNQRIATELNARIEGVAERVDIRDADMTDLPFDDATFDLVTASLAIHNIAAADDRARAVREIVRVTRPGGRIVIIDIARTREYQRVLRDAGIEDTTRTGLSFAIYPPARTITAVTPS